MVYLRNLIIISYAYMISFGNAFTYACQITAKALCLLGLSTETGDKSQRREERREYQWGGERRGLGGEFRKGSWDLI